ncbi:hypothetical protein L1887_30066 [Cichorium endivia]|nr:hypothetical protein L1887_30066 [Cichorium endivia]
MEPSTMVRSLIMGISRASSMPQTFPMSSSTMCESTAPTTSIHLAFLSTCPLCACFLVRSRPLLFVLSGVC